MKYLKITLFRGEIDYSVEATTDTLNKAMSLFEKDDDVVIRIIPLEEVKGNYLLIKTEDCSISLSTFASFEEAQMKMRSEFLLIKSSINEETLKEEFIKKGYYEDDDCTIGTSYASCSSFVDYNWLIIQPSELINSEKTTLPKAESVVEYYNIPSDSTHYGILFDNKFILSLDNSNWVQPSDYELNSESSDFSRLDDILKYNY